MITVPQSEKLNTAGLARIFDSKNESYKLFWFKALLDNILNGRLEISFNDMVNIMIKDAWYMVSEYRLNLGPADGIEKAVHYLAGLSGLKSAEKESVILDFLRNCEDKGLEGYRARLCDNVPYRLQSSFVPEMNRSLWGSNTDCARYMNLQKGLIYTFNDAVCEKGRSYRDKGIIVNPVWADYLLENYAILLGWTEYNLITYLQRRNPSVPGIPDKISAPAARKLDSVKNYWRAVLEYRPGEIKDIYTGNELSRKDLSIDHFVPWSYVAHDEFWNLVPTSSSVNSSKSNNLPVWDVYFPRLADIEYMAYGIHESMKVAKAYGRCLANHVNSDDVRCRLYRPGQSKEEFTGELESILRPSYEAARHMGFGMWSME